MVRWKRCWYTKMAGGKQGQIQKLGLSAVYNDSAIISNVYVNSNEFSINVICLVFFCTSTEKLNIEFFISENIFHFYIPPIPPDFSGKPTYDVNWRPYCSTATWNIISDGNNERIYLELRIVFFFFRGERIFDLELPTYWTFLNSFAYDDVQHVRLGENTFKPKFYCKKKKKKIWTEYNLDPRQY